MYAIAYKIGPRSSWLMYAKVYDDRENCDNQIEWMRKRDGYWKVRRVFFNADV